MAYLRLGNNELPRSNRTQERQRAYRTCIYTAATLRTKKVTTHGLSRLVSYTPEDAAWDEAYEAMSRELYPEHKEQAIAEFVRERLRSYYKANPNVLVPAVRTYKEGNVLLEKRSFAASLVFAASAAELFLKTALLRPVVYGFVHSEPVAEVIVAATLSQTGLLRYRQLLAKLFLEIAGIEIHSLSRSQGGRPLLDEAAALQELRNHVLHRGDEIVENQAVEATAIASAVFSKILAEVLSNLGLDVAKGGVISVK